ncbi:MAG: DUF4405 domain-containing protein [Bacteroidota bacterium]
MKISSKTSYNLPVDLILIVAGFITAFSGLLLQFRYHAGRVPRNTGVLYLDYFQWAAIHKILSITFFFVLCAHLYLHAGWYKAILRQKSFLKNQTVVLSIILLMTSLTGLIPWMQSSFSIFVNSEMPRAERHLVEIHDKVSLVLVIYLGLHVKNRFGWLRNKVTKLLGLKARTI